MYVCGPTVYDVGHLGHARAAVSFDLIRRYFLYKGFKVTFVSNFTDVDDKMIKRAAQEGITEQELAAKIIPEYERDYAALKVLTADHQPRATQYIPKMVALVEKLLKKGIAYTTEDGVYFEVSKCKDYGKLSNKKVSDLQAGARIAVDEKKKNPEDFALWKKEKSGEPAWDGPAKMRGRPGWHIECSAMSADLLGETFDIHGGGIDLIFPHHEDEVAQSESATDKAFAKYWLHNGHIQVNKEKMSKSLGNFFTIKEVLAKYHPAVVRYFLLSTHYRMPIDFSDDLLEQAKNSLERLHDCFRVLKKIAEKNDDDTNLFDIQTYIENAKKKFQEAMDDDFEISRALSALFDFVNIINIMLNDGDINQIQARLALTVFNDIDGVLQVILLEDGVLPEKVEALITERNEARKNKNFKRADEIRKELEGKGILLEDTQGGTVWKRML